MFKRLFYNRIKAHDTLTIGIKCILPKELRNDNFTAKPFRPFTNYLPLKLMLQFKKGKRFFKNIYLEDICYSNSLKYIKIP